MTSSTLPKTYTPRELTGSPTPLPWWQIDEEVEEDGSVSLRLAIPTAVAPRYQPACATDMAQAEQEHAVALVERWPRDLLTITGSITTASQYVPSLEASLEALDWTQACWL